MYKQREAVSVCVCARVWVCVCVYPVLFLCILYDFVSVCSFLSDCSHANMCVCVCIFHVCVLH